MHYIDSISFHCVGEEGHVSPGWKVETRLTRHEPLGSLVGGALRAQAYMMEGSSSQVPDTLPQSLERERERNEAVDNQYHSAFGDE